MLKITKCSFFIGYVYGGPGGEGGGDTKFLVNMKLPSANYGCLLECVVFLLLICFSFLLFLLLQFHAYNSPLLSSSIIV